jgi:hypothetical protein
MSTTPRRRTVMAYNHVCSEQSFNCTRLLYWSNPGASYNDAAMGIPGGTKSDCPTGDVMNVSCEADDHRTLNETALTVANVRPSARRPASDFTADLKSDILWHHATRGEVWLWPMNGSAAQAVSYVDTVDLGYAVAGSGDLDGDRKADILWRHATRGDVWAWLMNGAVKVPENYVTTVPEVECRIVRTK